MLEILEHFQFLYDGAAFFFSAEGWKNLVMILIGGLLIYLALAKDFEPALLMPASARFWSTSRGPAQSEPPQTGPPALSSGYFRWGLRRRKPCRCCCSSASAP